MKTVCRITPKTDASYKWLTENLDTKPWNWQGRTVIIERGYIGPIIEGMELNGFKSGTDYIVTDF